ncbi:phosphonate C-P lyase system protein PhnH, partial [Zavarzinia sp.]|uniref:phosphonate C-P lyase system protein PhnH n=1 Tax=Zavarzinia sp. TaxID=2027920 RepID=UPI003568D300
GFARPVFQAQAAFRAVLDAMSRPGRIHRLAEPATAPAGLSPAAASVLAALADGDTPVYLGCSGAAAQAFVTRALGAPRVALGEAAFAVVTAADLLPLDRFAPGSESYPDRSATVIVEVTALGRGTTYRLRGPGVQGTAELAVEGLPAGFGAAWMVQRAGFPTGVDLVICCGDRLAALPRTVAVE